MVKKLSSFSSGFSAFGELVFLIGLMTLTSISAFTQSSLFPTTIQQGATHPLPHNVHVTSQNFLLIYSVRPCNLSAFLFPYPF